LYTPVPPPIAAALLPSPLPRPVARPRPSRSSSSRHHTTTIFFLLPLLLCLFSSSSFFVLSSSAKISVLRRSSLELLGLPVITPVQRKETREKGGIRTYAELRSAIEGGKVDRQARSIGRERERRGKRVIPRRDCSRRMVIVEKGYHANGREKVRQGLLSFLPSSRGTIAHGIDADGIDSGRSLSRARMFLSLMPRRREGRRNIFGKPSESR